MCPGLLPCCPGLAPAADSTTHPNLRLRSTGTACPSDPASSTAAFLSAQVVVSLAPHASLIMERRDWSLQLLLRQHTCNPAP